MNTLLLLLLDSRAPAGAHHHSGGMEAAVATGLVSADPVRGLAGLEDFCRTRLRTSARVAAAFAAAAARLQPTDPERAGSPAPAPERALAWAELDAEFEARTPSEATRAASRQLGGGWCACSVRSCRGRIWSRRGACGPTRTTRSSWGPG